jgi:hypothetical protein
VLDVDRLVTKPSEAVFAEGVTGEVLKAPVKREQAEP